MANPPTPLSESPGAPGMILTGWEKFYGLGYYHDGKPYLTTWMGDRPIVRKLSINCAPWKIPLWTAEVPSGASLIDMPTDALALDRLVREQCACVVIGWEMPEAVERKPWNAHV